MNELNYNFLIAVLDFYKHSDLKKDRLSEAITSIYSSFYNIFQFPTSTTNSRRKYIKSELKIYQKYLDEVNKIHSKISVESAKKNSDASSEKFHRDISLQKLDKMLDDLESSVSQLNQVLVNKKTDPQLIIASSTISVSILVILMAILLHLFL